MGFRWMILQQRKPSKTSAPVTHHGLSIDIILKFAIQIFCKRNLGNPRPYPPSAMPLQVPQPGMAPMTLQGNRSRCCPYSLLNIRSFRRPSTDHYPPGHLPNPIHPALNMAPNSSRGTLGLRLQAPLAPPVESVEWKPEFAGGFARARTQAQVEARNEEDWRNNRPRKRMSRKEWTMRPHRTAACSDGFPTCRW